MSSQDRPLRVGMIGCGLVMELKHMVVLQSVPDAVVIAVADTDAGRLQRVADTFHIATRCADPLELLAHPDIDAVAVCTPPEQHAALVLAALDAGKHVLVEKPLALDLDECDRMVERARRSDRKVLVGFHMRWHRQTRYARDAIRAGSVGAVELVRGVWTNALRLDRELPEWRGHRETGGGALIELGVHIYDLFRFWLDADVEEIFVLSRSRDWPDETVSLTARMSNGVLASAVISEVTGCDMEFEVYGRDGRLRLACLRYDGTEAYDRCAVPGGMQSSLRRLAGSITQLPRGIAQGRHGGDYLLSYRYEWEHFVTAIRSGAAVECDLEDGRHAVRVALAAVQSAATGQPVRIAAAPRRLPRSAAAAASGGAVAGATGR